MSVVVMVVVTVRYKSRINTETGVTERKEGHSRKKLGFSAREEHNILYLKFSQLQLEEK